MLLALRVGIDLAALGVLVVLARRSAPHLARGAGWKVAAALVVFTTRTRGRLWRTLPEQLLREPVEPRLEPRFREVGLLLVVRVSQSS